jgi:hypothetical protein
VTTAVSRCLVVSVDLVPAVHDCILQTAPNMALLLPTESGSLECHSYYAAPMVIAHVRAYYCASPSWHLAHKLHDASQSRVHFSGNLIATKSEISYGRQEHYMCVQATNPELASTDSRQPDER